MIRFLIDGYNFLNASGIESHSTALPAGTPLERSRLAMLEFLVTHLTQEEIADTVVVFDARYVFRPHAAEFTYHGLVVRFAVGYPDADSLVERIIQEHSSPKHLTVVSSDHRIQRAARRRRAKFVDSELWYQQLSARRLHHGQREQPPDTKLEKETVELSPEELKQLLEGYPLPTHSTENARIPSIEVSNSTTKESEETATSGEENIQNRDETSGSSSSEPATPVLSVEQWAKQMGFSPEELNLPIESLKDVAQTVKKPRRRSKM